MCIHKAIIEECCSYSQRTVMCSAEGLYNSWIFLGHNTKNIFFFNITMAQLDNGLHGQ